MPLPGGSGSIEPASFGENWLLLWSDKQGEEVVRPLLMVLERRPERIDLSDDGFGGKAISLRFARAGARVLLVRPFAGPLGALPSREAVDRCRLWSRALLQYPIG